MPLSSSSCSKKLRGRRRKRQQAFSRSTSQAVAFAALGCSMWSLSGNIVMAPAAAAAATGAATTQQSSSTSSLFPPKLPPPPPPLPPRLLPASSATSILPASDVVVPVDEENLRRQPLQAVGIATIGEASKEEERSQHVPALANHPPLVSTESLIPPPPPPRRPNMSTLDQQQQQFYQANQSPATGTAAAATAITTHEDPKSAAFSSSRLLDAQSYDEESGQQQPEVEAEPVVVGATVPTLRVPLNSDDNVTVRSNTTTSSHALSRDETADAAATDATRTTTSTGTLSQRQILPPMPPFTVNPSIDSETTMTLSAPSHAIAKDNADPNSKREQHEDTPVSLLDARSQQAAHVEQGDWETKRNQLSPLQVGSMNWNATNTGGSSSSSNTTQDSFTAGEDAQYSNVAESFTRMPPQPCRKSKAETGPQQLLPPMSEPSSWTPQQQQHQQRPNPYSSNERFHQRQPPHYQQQQQYPNQQTWGRRPEPTQRRGPQTRQQQQQQQRPAWKSLWQRVEKGLDSLANLEDVVAVQARKVYHSAVNAAAATTTTATTTIPSRLSTPAWRSPRTKRHGSVEKMDMTRFQKTTAGDGSTSMSSISAATVSAAVATTTSRENEPIEKTTATAMAATGPRSIDWNSVRSIRANGGASTPPASTTRSSYQQQQSPSQLQSQPQSSGQLLRPANLQQQGFPISSEAQLSSGTNQQLQQTNPIPSFKTFSQAAALPAHETFGPTASTPVRRYVGDDDDDDDDDDDKSMLARIRRLVPPLPRLGLPSWLLKSASNDFAAAALDAWRKDDDDASLDENRGFFGIFSRKKPDPTIVSRVTCRSEPKEILTSPMIDLMQRIEKGDTTSLLSMHEEDECRSIGRQKAFFDLMVLVGILAIAKTMPTTSDIHLPTTIVEAFTTTISSILSFLAASTDTWAPFALAVVYLSSKSRALVCDRKQATLSANAAAAVQDEAKYGSLFLRLTSSVSVDTDTFDHVQSAARTQISSKVDMARLHTFIIGVVACFLVTALAVLKPLLLACIGAIGNLLSLPELLSWPPRGREVAAVLLSAVGQPLRDASTLLTDSINGIKDDPTRFLFNSCFILSLAAVAYIPLFEGQRQGSKPLSDVSISEPGEKQLHAKVTEQVSNLGISGASRLSLAAVDGRVDSVLERWRAMTPQANESTPVVASFQSLARLLGYVLLSGAILFSPLLIVRLSDLAIGSSGSGLFGWDFPFDAAVALLFTFQLVWDAIATTIQAEDVKTRIEGFVSAVQKAVEERRRVLGAPPPSIQLQASLSPTAGISVHDLWASHVTKRAWAVRGASLTCRNGEVVVLLGENGAGKTRLLTTIAESVVSPPSRALSAQKVRGTISIGGVDVSKWDNRQLKGRLGIALNDVRSVSDTAQILSGLSLEEILNPCTGIHNLDPSRTPSSNERAAMMLALQVTGLSTTLLPRLPSKLATIVTASEEDLLPSATRPRYQILSPAEWSNLLLTRVLAQAIYDNDNSSGSNENLLNSLVGSVLLLDDHLLHLSEVEEARLLFDLRQSGAATIVTSNRWATGRFADRIFVMKDGAIVESGTHAELLNRGPQQSIYAAKWHAMTNA